ncbi:hypothetical protein DSECCO2_560820 [anaerobic digester metagenome]
MKRCPVHGALDIGGACDGVAGNEVDVERVDRRVDVGVLGILLAPGRAELLRDPVREGETFLLEGLAGEGGVKEHEDIEVPVAPDEGVAGDRAHHHRLCHT